MSKVQDIVEKGFKADIGLNSGILNHHPGTGLYGVKDENKINPQVRSFCDQICSKIRTISEPQLSSIFDERKNAILLNNFGGIGDDF